MTLTLSRPPRAPFARQARRDRADYLRADTARIKADVEPSRITITCGCHLVGWWDTTASIDDVLSHLVRGANDPEHLPALGYPLWLDRWPWDRGEDLAVWQDCRLRALASLKASGEVLVRHFD